MTLRDAGVVWADALQRYSAQLLMLWEEMRSPVERAVPDRARIIVDSLGRANLSIDALRSVERPDEDVLAAIAAADHGELATRLLEKIDIIMSASDMIFLSLRSYSRSYSEDVYAKQRGARLLRAPVRAAQFDFIARATRKPWDGALEQTSGSFFAQTHGAGATEIFTSLLSVALADPGRRAAAVATLEYAKDTLLRPGDAVAEVREGHPIQQMGIVVGPLTRGEGGAPIPLGETGAALDLRYSTARPVVYDFAPLVSPEAAAAFGPLATTDYGLNFTLVRRFRTMWESAVAPAAPAAPAARQALPATFREACVDGKLSATIDGTSTVTIGAPGKWVPGPRPRVLLYNEACEAVVAAAVGDAEERGRQLLRELDAAQQDEKDLATGSSAVADALTAAFATAFDTVRPRSVTELLEKVVEASPGFILAGLMKAIDVRRAFFRGVSSEGLIPYPHTHRECISTIVCQVAALATDIRKQMMGVYWNWPGVWQALSGGPTQRDHPERGSAAPPPPVDDAKVRAAVLEHFARSVLPIVMADRGDSMQIMKRNGKLHLALTKR